MNFAVLYFCAFTTRLNSGPKFSYQESGILSVHNVSTMKLIFSDIYTADITPHYSTEKRAD